jgi:ribosome-associated translation inhibitor RaiA
MTQLQVTFRGMQPSEAVRTLAEEKFQKLAKQLGNASTCHLVLARPVAGQHKGAAVSALVQLRASRGLLATAEARNTDPFAAVREAFAHATSQVASRAARAHEKSNAEQLNKRPHLFLIR